MPGTNVKLVDKCSCMDGTWGMKKQYYELSKKGMKLLDGLVEDEPDIISTDCMIAKLQISEGTGRDVQHPIEHRLAGLLRFRGDPAGPRQAQWIHRRRATPVLTAADILPNDEYVAQRQRFLSQMLLSHKKVLSLRLGDAMTFLFENNVTMRFQIQEKAASRTSTRRRASPTR